MYKKLIYKMITVDGKQVPEHRYFMEQHLGRKLNKNEVVHHINHNHFDNKIKNLQVMTNEEHVRYHATLSNHGKWTRDDSYEKCIDCSTKERPHYIKGFCERCFERRRLVKRREYNRESCRKRYYANRKQRLKQIKEFYENNPEKKAAKVAYYKEYRRKNYAILYKKKRAYLLKNPEKWRLYMKEYRLKHKNKTP